MPRAWSFARVSSQQQADFGGGLERQADEALAARWCAAHGYELSDRLEFTGSAYKGHHLADGAPLRAWLDQAAAGLLGDAPALLVEEIDRFTRQAAHHALAELLSVAFPAGVVIVSLRDGTEYSQKAFERDDRLLGDLLEEIRSAHRYSKRLSRRLTAYWDQVRARVAAGQPVRPDAIAPFWATAVSGGWELNDLAPLARRIFAEAREVGATTIARRLNAEGVPALARRGPSSRPWTSAGLLSHLRNPAAYGAARMLRRGRAARDGREEIVVDGYFPPLITREEWDQVQAAIEARIRDTDTRGTLGTCRWIGQRLTRCSCGASVGVISCGRREGRRRVYFYLRCSRRKNQPGVCEAPSYRLDVATAHLLTRLRPGQLQHLICGTRDRQEATRAAVICRDQAAAQVEAAERSVEAARVALTDAILDGRSVEVFVDAHQEAKRRAAVARTELEDAAAELTRLVEVGAASALEEPAAAMLRAFARGKDTPEQRRAVQAGLRRLGVTITLAGDRPAMGISIGGGQPDWQPVTRTRLGVLRRGRTGIETVDHGDVAATLEPDWVTIDPL